MWKGVFRNILRPEKAHTALVGLLGLFAGSIYKVFVEPYFEQFKDPISEFISSKSTTNGFFVVVVMAYTSLLIAMVLERFALGRKSIGGLEEMARKVKARDEEIEQLKRARLARDKDLSVREEASRRERNTDYVTGIFNNRAFILDLQKRIDFLAQQRKLSDENSPISKAAKKSRQDSVIMIDLDGFGNVNQTFGFDAGDAVIRSVAQVINGSIRRNEFMYRKNAEATPLGDVYRRHTGGDEFLVILQGNEVDAVFFLGRLKSTILPECTELARAALREIFQGAKQEEIDNLQLGFTAGVVQIRSDDTTEEVIDRVDACFWSAKDGSFGTSVVWGSLLDEWEAIRNALVADGIPVMSFAMFDSRLDEFRTSHPILIDQLGTYVKSFPGFDRAWEQFGKKGLGK